MICSFLRQYPRGHSLPVQRATAAVRLGSQRTGLRRKKSLRYLNAGHCSDILNEKDGGDTDADCHN